MDATSRLRTRNAQIFPLSPSIDEREKEEEERGRRQQQQPRHSTYCMHLFSQPFLLFGPLARSLRSLTLRPPRSRSLSLSHSAPSLPPSSLPSYPIQQEFPSTLRSRHGRRRRHSLPRSLLGCERESKAGRAGADPPRAGEAATHSPHVCSLRPCLPSVAAPESEPFLSVLLFQADLPLLEPAFQGIELGITYQIVPT